VTQIPASTTGITGVTGTAGGVSNDTSRLKSDANLAAAGERFEAIFTGMMLKSMRSAKLADGLFDNKAGEQFRDMFDGKIAESMAQHSPMGIARAMTEFLAKTQGSAAAPGDGAGTP